MKETMYTEAFSFRTTVGYGVNRFLVEHQARYKLHQRVLLQRQRPV
jgi:hypothetical protein